MRFLDDLKTGAGDLLSGGKISAGREQRRGLNRARTSLTSGYGTAADQLRGGYGGARGELSPLASQTANTFGNLTRRTMAGEFAPGTEDIEADPAYLFALRQGRDQILGKQAASGMLKSGATQKALMDYGAGAASRYAGDVRDFNLRRGQQEYAQNYALAQPAIGLAEQLAGYRGKEGEGLSGMSTELAQLLASLDIGKGNVNAGIQTAGYGPLTDLLNKGITHYTGMK